MKPPISVCIIGLNEERKVEDCLKSVVDLADEIIFVDSFSTDGTLKIVKKYTKKVFQNKFVGHVEQKRFAIKKATHDWILALDCDERLTPEAINKVKEIWQQKSIEIENEKLRAISFRRLTFYIYRFIYHSGWYPDNKIRLFNRKYCNWQGENPHDRIECDKKYLLSIKEHILHYSFDSISDHLKTIDSFAKISSQQAYDKGRRAGVLTIIFRSLWVAIRKIFFEFAFLDGAAGIILTGLSVTATWAKYSRLYLLGRADKNK